MRRLPLLLTLSLLAGAAAAGDAPLIAGVPVPDPQFLRDFAETNAFRLGHPTAIKLSPDGQRAYFLRSGARDPVQRLYETDLASGETRELITPAQVLGGAEEQLSVAEKARRERLRLSAKGFTSFQLSPDGKSLVLPLSGKVYALDRASGKVRALYEGDAAVETPTLSGDGQRLAYVKDYDLYVRELSSGTERRLTRGGSETLTHGMAEFVAQEEMGRLQGFWWSPDGRTLAYEEADHRGMERFAIADPAKPEKAPQSFYYPRPGKANAKVRLGLVPANGGKTSWVRWDAERYPYLLRVEWPKTAPVQAPLTLIVQSRDQREQAILAVTPGGATKTLLVQKDVAWLDPDFSFVRWLPDGSGFLTAIEASGRAELERYDARGGNRQVLIAGTHGFLELAGVTDDGRIYALAAPKPEEVQLLRLTPGAQGYGAPELLRGGPGEREVSIARESGDYVLREWTLDETAAVYGADGQQRASLPSVGEAPRTWPGLSFVTVEAEGQSFHAAVLRPRDFDPKKQYPVIDSVYGGPTVSKVTAKALDYLREQWLADHGAIVVRIDNRGTPRRDRAWARAFKDAEGRNGDGLSVILHDQALALRELAKTIPQMDIDRVGIYGWSYGGTSSAAAVLRMPELFKVGVAGAPVTDWLDYDTHYTERYLDLPAVNPQGYAKSSLLDDAPNLQRPLLLIHGTGDDNVYFSHSLKLADALFKAGKPFEFLPLINFTHMVADPRVQERLYGRIAGFLFQHLGTPQPLKP